MFLVKWVVPWIVSFASLAGKIFVAHFPIICILVIWLNVNRNLSFFCCRMGLTRHLTAAEIVEQAVYAQRLLYDEVGTFKNVVFMVRLWDNSIYRKIGIIRTCVSAHVCHMTMCLLSYRIIMVIIFGMKLISYVRVARITCKLNLRIGFFLSYWNLFIISTNMMLSSYVNSF